MIKSPFPFKLRLPCYPLCAEKLRKYPPNRVQLHCLTCLDRRYYYNKIDRVNYVKVRKGQKFMMVQPHSDVVLPRKSRWYCLIINNSEGSMLKRWVKGFLTSVFLSLAEVFANW